MWKETNRQLIWLDWRCNGSMSFKAQRHDWALILHHWYCIPKSKIEQGWGPTAADYFLQVTTPFTIFTPACRHLLFIPNCPPKRFLSIFLPSPYSNRSVFDFLLFPAAPISTPAEANCPASRVPLPCNVQSSSLYLSPFSSPCQSTFFPWLLYRVMFHSLRQHSRRS